jgi:hypothetical protein
MVIEAFAQQDPSKRFPTNLSDITNVFANYDPPIVTCYVIECEPK